MVHEERNVWAGLVITVIAMTAYVVIVLQRAAGGPLTDVVWWPTMLWTIGASIAGSILVSIAWGIVSGRTDPDNVGRSDERDRHIAHMGSRVGQAFTVIAGLGVIALCALEAHWFWIAHTMFFGFALSAFIGGVASVIAYRQGLV